MHLKCILLDQCKKISDTYMSQVPIYVWPTSRHCLIDYKLALKVIWHLCDVPFFVKVCRWQAKPLAVWIRCWRVIRFTLKSVNVVIWFAPPPSVRQSQVCFCLRHHEYWRSLSWFGYSSTVVTFPCLLLKHTTIVLSSQM